jgi:signal transduction histidine kinase
LRLRLAALFSAATALAIATGGIIFIRQLRSDLNDTIDSGLRAELAEVAQELTTSGHAPPLGPADDPILVERLDGTPVAASPAAAGRKISPQQRQQALGGDLLFDTEVAGANDRVLISTVAAAAPTGRVVVAVANDTDLSDDAVERVRDGLLIAGPLTAVLTGLGAWLLADTALRPVQRMRRDAAGVGEHDPELRLAIPATRDEVAELGVTINGLLDRLHMALDRERRFVADASHELRTPLAILRTELELAVRPGRSAEEIRAAVVEATQETERLTNLTDDLLLLARADNRQPIIDPVPVDVAELLAATIARAPEHPPGIVLDCPGDLRVVADPDRLGQAVRHLLDTAVVHSPPDMPVRLTACRGDDGRIVIEVIDAGPGFDPRFLPVAFERFRRAGPERSRSTGGTGLGLAVVHAIAEAHWGTAHVVNRPGGGAGATIRLPLIPPLTGHVGARGTTPAPPQRGGPTSARGTARSRPAANPWPAPRPRDRVPGDDSP